MYSEEFPIPIPIVPPLWDHKVVPYIDVRQLLAPDLSAMDRMQITNALLDDQAQRARMHEELLSNEQRRVEVEDRRMQDEDDRRQPDVVESLRAQRAVSGKRKFTRASVEANTRWTDLCRTSASMTHTLVTSVNSELGTPRNSDPEESRSRAVRDVLRNCDKD